MKFDCLTLFPEMFEALDQSIIGRAKEKNLIVKPLWLERLSSIIYISSLIKKYNYNKKPYNIDLIVGEYDVPSNQEQKLLTLSLTDKGNSVIYGVSGSGKENFITTILYSSLIYYSPEELNYYVIDFGSSIVRIFENANIIGDIINREDEEKIENLFKLIEKELDKRKQLFYQYNGEYTSYIKNNKTIIPALVVIINNFELFDEMYEKYNTSETSSLNNC